MKGILFTLLIIYSISFLSCSTPNEVENNQQVSKEGLLLFLDFEGSNVVDQSPFKHFCELNGAQIMMDRFDNSNSFIYFNGLDNYIRIHDSEELTPSNMELTICFWCSVIHPGNKFILYKGSTQYNREYAVGIREDSLFAFQVNNNGDWLERSSVASKVNIDEYTWTHVACVWDGETQKIYINSELDNEIASSLEVQDYNSDLYIGTYGGAINKYAFHGILDNLFIFNRVLDEKEIKLLMKYKME